MNAINTTESAHSITARTVDQKITLELERAGLAPLLARLFAARGVTSFDQTVQDLNRLIPPDTLLNANAAAELLADAIATRKKLLIVTDYDCDGATACAVGMRALRSMGAVVDYLVPSRFETGYGLTPEVVQLAIQHPRLGKPDILITADNGIASVSGVAAANATGLQVLVTDHHLPGAVLPQAACIVNPNQPGCTFASKHIAGVGVMFYVMLSLRALLRSRYAFKPHTALEEPRLDGLLDLVALGTVADVVQLDANNRTLVAQGLQRMRNGKLQAGVRALFEVAGRHPRVATSFDLGFALGPRINAAGRLQDMSLGIECLITDDADAALRIAQQLDTINRERRQITSDMQDDALMQLEHYDPSGRASIVLFDAQWHQGVVGIIAGKIKEKFYRPTIAFAPDKDGLLRGSGRSIANIHLRDALDLVDKAQPGLLIRFGGHAMAAGLTIRHTDLAQFTQCFEQIVVSLLGKNTLLQEIQTDGSLPATEYRPDVVALLESQVWGNGFAPPLFCDQFTVVGTRVLKDAHLKLSLKPDLAHTPILKGASAATTQKPVATIDAIWFNQTSLPGQRLKIAYRLTNNEYQGRITTQIQIEAAQALPETN